MATRYMIQTIQQKMKSQAVKTAERLIDPTNEWDNHSPIPPPDLGEEIQSLMDKMSRAKQYLSTNELITHYSLTYTVEDDASKVLVIDFCRQLIKEYRCQTPSEVMLAEIASSAFVRHLEYAQKLQSLMQLVTYSQEYSNKNLSIVGKEVDRSYRLYISALFALKQLKSNMLTVNVKAKTAFVAQNQQVNASSQTVVKGENNEPR